jgi:hypothetical protein
MKPEESDPAASNPNKTMRTRDGQVLAVPPEGNLGLLAAGYRGLMLWREARAASGWTAAQAAKKAVETLKSFPEPKTRIPEGQDEAQRKPGNSPEA